MKKSLFECAPGEYIVLEILENISSEFKSALSAIGLTKGQVIIVLKDSNKKDVFVELNEATYLLRRKTTKYVQVKEL